MADITRYQLYRDKISSGDLVFMSGRGFFSNVIKAVTKSQYSHVGMAIWLSIEILDEPRLFIMESTTLNNIKDGISNEYRRGVQFVPLSQRIEAYEGDVAWAELCDPLTDDEKKFLLEWCMKIETSKISYDDFVSLAKAAIDVERWPWYFKWLGYPFKGLLTSKQNLSRQFCSELVTATLQKVGKIDANVNPSEQVPEDLLHLSCVKQPLPLT